MRDNGLGADRPISYTVLADLNPPVADAMLDMLRREGIAAYAAPSPGSRGLLMDVRYPDGPVDRVWVDSDALDAARAVLERHLGQRTAGSGESGGAPPLDEELAWQQIVESFDLPSADPVPRWPADEDVDASSVHFGRRRSDRENSQAVLSFANEEEEDPEPRYAEDEDHFVPPPPPPLPQARPATKWAIASMIGGVAMLVVSTSTDVQDASVLAFLGVVALVAGFVTLVVNMRDTPPTDSGPDDGAVV
jgi:hypothetical protein